MLEKPGMQGYKYNIIESFKILYWGYKGVIHKGFLHSAKDLGILIILLEKIKTGYGFQLG